MLGNAVFRVFGADAAHQTWGTLRSAAALRHFAADSHARLLCGVDVLDQDALTAVMAKVRPDVVINCVGLIKQLADAKDPLTALPINAMLPHRLARLCELGGARLIHVSTDCVFSGRKGLYQESDLSDAEDLYGKSKYIGELHDLPHAITLRTSIIGHELGSSHALVDWFLAQQGSVRGFTKAVFSGLPTVELARVMKDSAIAAVHWLALLAIFLIGGVAMGVQTLVAQAYGCTLEIVPDDRLVIDRSLDSSRFRAATGYAPPAWPELVQRMRDFG